VVKVREEIKKYLNNISTRIKDAEDLLWEADKILKLVYKIEEKDKNNEDTPTRHRDGP
jgi:hypothetical protein